MRRSLLRDSLAIIALLALTLAQQPLESVNSNRVAEHGHDDDDNQQQRLFASSSVSSKTESVVQGYPTSSATATTRVLMNTTITTSTTADALQSEFGSGSNRSPGTCRSGTVNHITRTLPQQCLTSSLTAPGVFTVDALPDAGDMTVDNGSSSSTGSSTETSLQSSTSSDVAHMDNSESTSQESVVTQEPTTSSQVETATTEPGTTDPASSASFSATAQSPQATEQTTEERTEAEAEREANAALDNANFLSFEEWKARNLAQAGQSPDGGHAAGQNQGRARPDMNLDALGDEGEIELDFSGFGAGVRPDIDKSRPRGEHGREVASSGTGADKTGGAGGLTSTGGSSTTLRSRDAGKTCKERSNYASFDCAATILKTNPEAKSANAILIENKDSYMLNPCSVANKFVIVELCDDILVDTIVLANYEFFSSIFRNFRVSVSDRYPVKAERWKELGVFEAKSSRSVQAFLVEQPLIWARYLRIEFLNHYGNEYYCPISLLRVHGTTMMEEFRHQEEVARGDDTDDVDGEELVEDEYVEKVFPEAGDQEPLEASVEADKSVVVESAGPIETSETTEGRQLEESQTLQEFQPTPSVDPALLLEGKDNIRSEAPTESSHLPNHTARDDLHSPSDVHPENKELLGQATQQGPQEVPSILDMASSSATEISVSDHIPHSNSTSSASNSTSSQETVTQTTAVDSVLNDDTASKNVMNSTSIATTDATCSESQPSKSLAQSVASKSSSAPQPQLSVNTTTNSTSIKASSSTSALPANPTTQESFFKSIHKRLQTLESNATLSLQYIESQSQLLRNAFQAVSKNQLKKTETFLSTLNATVSEELNRFKSDYERLWEGTVIELEMQRRQSEREVFMVTERLRVLADEVVWQKRIGVVQSTLLMLCLGLVLFARGSGTLGTGADITLLQQALSRSRWAGTLRQSKSHTDSPGRGGMTAADFYSPPNSPSPVGEFSSPDGSSGRTGFRAARWFRSGAAASGDGGRNERSEWRGSVDTGHGSAGNDSESLTESRPVSRDTNDKSLLVGSGEEDYGRRASMMSPKCLTSIHESNMSIEELEEEEEDQEDQEEDQEEEDQEEEDQEEEEESEEEDSMLDGDEQHFPDPNSDSSSSYEQLGRRVDFAAPDANGVRGEDDEIDPNYGTNIFIHHETQSSPSTPSGSRDQVATFGSMHDSADEGPDGAIQGTDILVSLKSRPQASRPLGGRPGSSGSSAGWGKGSQQPRPES